MDKIMLSISYKEISNISKRSWISIQQKNNSTIKVLHGSSVETHSTWFGDAIWAGDFNSPNLYNGYLLGSGACIEGKTAVYCPPFHSLSKLYKIKINNDTFVSNSFPLILHVTKSNLVADYALYCRDLYSVRIGINKCKKTIPTTNGIMNLIYSHSVSIDENLRENKIIRSFDGSFDDFSSYKNHVTKNLHDLMKNAADSRRKSPLSTLSTLSSGYDSACGTVIAHSLGCKEALSIEKASKFSIEIDDTGRNIAESLGMKHHIIDGSAYLSKDYNYEAEFISGHPTGEDIALASAEPMLVDRLLIVGHHGDKVWSPGLTNALDFKRGDASGGSLHEFALRIGMVVLPLPFIGAQWQPKINQISESSEMKPWSISGHYNRPIPRRFIEEAGIPRGSFAQEKKAVALSVEQILPLAKGNPDRAEIVQDFALFKQKCSLSLLSKIQFFGCERGGLFAEKVVNRINWAFSLLKIKYRIPRPYRSLVFRLGDSWPIFHWAISRSLANYKDVPRD